jgi:hypothetical protein
MALTRKAGEKKREEAKRAEPVLTRIVNLRTLGWGTYLAFYLLSVRLARLFEVGGDA